MQSREIVKPHWFTSAYKGALFQLSIVMIKYSSCDHGQVLPVCWSNPSESLLYRYNCIYLIKRLFRAFEVFVWNSQLYKTKILLCNLKIKPNIPSLWVLLEERTTQVDGIEMMQTLLSWYRVHKLLTSRVEQSLTH